MTQIAVLGFGRSGTTWISDIISKTLGRLILFEPLHPSVTELSERFSYAHVHGLEDSELLKSHFEKVLSKRHKKKWLLRNHVPFPLDQTSEAFLEMVWQECAVAGFKCIRANSMIEWLHNHLHCKIVYIVRHPCAVVSSIMRKDNFWEFGWPRTYEIFLRNTIYGGALEDHEIASIKEIAKNARDNISRYAVMWSITYVISSAQLKRVALPVFYYEHFYQSPLSSTKAMFEYLGYKDIDIHPSYIFTPSMTSLKTVHGLYGKDKDISKKGAAAFWENQLSGKEVDLIMDIVNSFGIRIYDNNSTLPIGELNKLNAKCSRI